MRTVALPAFQLGEERFAMGNAFNSDGRLRRNGDRRAGFFMFPTGREYLDIGHQIGAFLFAEGIPDRHVGVSKTAADGVVEILIGGQSAGQSGAALKGSEGKVPRFRIKPNRILAVAIAVIPVTAGAKAPVGCLPVGGVPGEITDVAL